MITDSNKLVSYVLRIVLIAVGIGLALLLLLFLGGCGKSGMPEPQDPARQFAWDQVEAKPAGNCIAFSGNFSGAYKNFDGIRLELAPVNGEDDCPGCPFVPEEVTQLSPREAGFNAQAGSIAFSYCPQPAPAYRWRLAGISVLSRQPHAVMPARFLQMNP